MEINYYRLNEYSGDLKAQLEGALARLLDMNWNNQEAKFYVLTKTLRSYGVIVDENSTEIKPEGLWRTSDTTLPKNNKDNG